MATTAKTTTAKTTTAKKAPAKKAPAKTAAKKAPAKKAPAKTTAKKVTTSAKPTAAAQPVEKKVTEAKNGLIAMLPFELPKFELPFDLPKVELPTFDELSDRFETLVADLREQATDRSADLRKRAETAVDKVRSTIGR